MRNCIDAVLRIAFQLIQSAVILLIHLKVRIYTHTFAGFFFFFFFFFFFLSQSHFLSNLRKNIEEDFFLVWLGLM